MFLRNNVSLLNARAQLYASQPPGGRVPSPWEHLNPSLFLK